MKVLYHIPSLHSIYAQRTIYNGFRNAFIDMGHEFRPLTADDNSNEVFTQFKPDLFITSTHFWYRKYLDFGLLKRYRQQGMFTLVKVDFWQSPIAKNRVNEAPSLKNDKIVLDLIHKDMLGDAYFHVLEANDPRMEGFEEGTGCSYYTIPLAADATLLKPMYDPLFVSDISYIGTNLPDKRGFFKKTVFPLKARCKVRFYGQDWTTLDRGLGWIQRIGQYFNLPVLRSLRKPKLRLEDEAKVYASSIISINVHEGYQRKYGGDCNERTFKIPLCGGFQVVDNVACIRRYFTPKTELIIADSDEDWLEKVHYYLRNPDERFSIIEAGRQRVLQEHTYHHRVEQMISIRRESRLYE